MRTKTMDSKLVALFVGLVVPDEPRYRTEAFNRAGNASQCGLLCGLEDAGIRFTAILSYLPIASFPRSHKMFVRGETTTFCRGMKLTLLSFINIMPIKQIHIGLSVFVKTFVWSVVNFRQKRIVYLYNLSRPPALFAYSAARLSGAKIVASIYDLGLPPENRAFMLWHRLEEIQARWIMPRLSGRIVITKKIMVDYAADAHSLLVDGGITDEVVAQLPDFENAFPAKAEFILAFAGRLTEENGIRLILQAFALLKDGSYRLWIAGQGPLEGEVREAVGRDPRIVYKGILTMREVMDMYRESQILLNIRLVRGGGTQYCFPSKLIEYFVVGRLVISTPVAHAADEYGGFGLFLKVEMPCELARLVEDGRKLGCQSRTEMGSRAREYVLANKTWRKQGERIAQYITTCDA